MAQKSALDEYLAFEAQVGELKERAIEELEAQKKALEAQIREIDGKLTQLKGADKGPTPQKKQRTRTTITIDQVKAAIKAGARTNKAVAKALGCVPATVSARIEAEGKQAGITSTGDRGSFKLHVK